jgi:hypothetical protein
LADLADVPWAVRVSNMPKRSINLAEQNLLFIFGERRIGVRTAAVQRLWTPDGIFVDAEGVRVGQIAVVEAAGALLKRFPEYEFWKLQKPDSIPGATRLAWAFGTVGLPPALTGFDILTFRANRIAAVYRFVDGAAF